MKGVVLGIGLLIVVGSLFLIFYSTSYDIGYLTLVVYQYRDYGYIVLLVGFVTIVIGAVIPGEKSSPSRRNRRTTAEDEDTEISSKCKYLTDNQACSALVNEEEGMGLRQEICTNERKDFCCYLCGSRGSCEISCNFLGAGAQMTPSKESKSDDIDKRISRYRETIEKLADSFAEGNISEESYVSSVKIIENKINRLANLKTKKSRQ